MYIVGARVAALSISHQHPACELCPVYGATGHWDELPDSDEIYTAVSFFPGLSI
jgi:hypothetical protein